jgi:transposase
LVVGTALAKRVHDILTRSEGRDGGIGHRGGISARTVPVLRAALTSAKARSKSAVFELLRSQTHMKTILILAVSALGVFSAKADDDYATIVRSRS